MIRPRYLNVELVFTDEEIKNLFSQYVSEKVGFPVELELNYDDETYRLMVSVKDEASYDDEEWEEICDVINPEEWYETADKLIQEHFGKDMDPKDFVRHWCEEADGGFLVAISVPYSYFQKHLRSLRRTVEFPDIPSESHIYVATVSHSLGVNVYAARTREDILEDLAGYVCEWWQIELNEPVPEGLSNEELIEQYFDRHPTEKYQIDQALFE